VKIDPPDDRPWSIRDFVVDPSGVLRRIGQTITHASRDRWVTAYLVAGKVSQPAPFPHRVTSAGCAEAYRHFRSTLESRHSDDRRSSSVCAKIRPRVAAGNYSIISSALTSKVGGGTTPIFFAAFILMDRRKLVGCRKGISAGVCPDKICAI
jgi:hypothetical protein